MRNYLSFIGTFGEEVVEKCGFRLSLFGGATTVDFSCSRAQWPQQPFVRFIEQLLLKEVSCR